MSTFDVAIGLDQTSINGVISQLFDNATLKAKIYQGNVTKDISPLGNVSLTYTVNAAPTIVLAAPAKSDWDKALPADGPAYPASNAFQLSLSNVTVEFTVASAKPVTAMGSISVYGTLSVANDLLNLNVQKVLLDETDFSAVDQLIVNGIIIPQALEIAHNTVSGVAIPRIPTFNQSIGGKTVALEFQDPVAGILDEQLIIATAIEGNAAPSLSGFTPPANKGMYLLSGINPINKVLGTVMAGYNSSGNPKTGGSAFNAEASYSVTVDTAQMAIEGSNLQISVTFDDITASAGVGGVGTAVAKTLLCPVDTAVEAIQGKSIDKITAVVSVTVSPSPLPIPLTIAAETTSGEQDAQASVGTLDDVSVTTKPEWSDVIGSTFAAGASAIMDLLTTKIQDAIVNDIIKDHLQNVDLFTIPAFSKVIEGVTVTPALDDGEFTVVDKMISGTFTITLS